MFCTTGEGRHLTVVRGIGLAFLLTTYLVWVTGCATAPPAPIPAVEDYLVPDQSAYFGVAVAANRDLVAYVAGALGAEAEVIVNRIDLFAGSLEFSVAGDPVFSGVALGRFPQGATRIALWKDRGFKRSVVETDGDRLVYYRQADGLLEVAVPESGIILLSTDSVAGLIHAVEPGQDRLDAETVDHIRSVGGLVGAGPDIVIVLPEPASLLSGSLGLDFPRVPILRVSLAVTVEVAEDMADTEPAAAGPPVPAVHLELAGEFEFSSEAQAALFGRLSRVFIPGFVRALGLDTTNLRDTVEIETNGTEVLFRGVTMSPDDLVGLAIRLTGQE